ncbi:MAG: SDR family oxidoreductase [Gammaproteobacteria bacterium]|nr:SDR family oxidoreductase [Gammaproteobacteria bacterium]
MACVVITGGTKGIGKAYAMEFLKRSYDVVITGRDTESLQTVVEECQALQSGRVLACVCDVNKEADYLRLWHTATEAFGAVDIWINNAAFGHSPIAIERLSWAQLETVIQINLMGSMLGSKVAYEAMLKQGHGHIYITLGAGADKRLHPRMLGYATSKCGLQYFARCLVQEALNTPVKISMLHPGVTITEGLLRETRQGQKQMSAAEFKEFISIINLLGERVETNVPWLVDQMINNQKSGREITWMTPRRFLMRLIKSWFVKRDVLTEFGIS